jgi:hypothetical protein
VDIEGADWKVHVIKDDGMVNAFVLPGYVLLGQDFSTLGIENLAITLFAHVELLVTRDAVEPSSTPAAVDPASGYRGR